jgi:hypothetical protein
VEADCRAESAQLPEKEPLSVEVWQRVCWISASPRSSAGKLRSPPSRGLEINVAAGDGLGSIGRRFGESFSSES